MLLIQQTMYVPSFSNSPKNIKTTFEMTEVESGSEIHMPELSHFRGRGKSCAKLIFAENCEISKIGQFVAILKSQIGNFLTEK